MPLIHYLNVKEGDCSIIQHYSGHVTVIDVCNAKEVKEEVKLEKALLDRLPIKGNFNQKEHPENPIDYLTNHGITSVFRFIATHPDMDHLDGLKALFNSFSPLNFWDTDNNESKDFSNAEYQKYDEEDWDYYTTLRDSKPEQDPRRLTLFSGSTGKYFNQDDENGGGDGIQLLSPTPQLVREANESGDYNDLSYVLLYRTDNHRIIFSGDSQDKSWQHILDNHARDIADIDLLIAPHHGRDSGMDFSFLDVLRPKLTFFGNASSQHLAYDKWNSRGLVHITNNQAGSMVVATTKEIMSLYVTNQSFAKQLNADTFYSEEHKAYYCGDI